MKLLKFSRLAIMVTMFSLSLTSSAFAVEEEPDFMEIGDKLIIFLQMIFKGLLYRGSASIQKAA
ncbi:MAG: hypothetical protein K0R76_1588 [Alphaproteobacteria bacterium]|nr:hypothetical protein [Alphaproteobacteria bacterium]